jgi:hypothetical protein
MRDTPMAIARNQSESGTPLPLPCPQQNRRSLTTAYSSLELILGSSSKEKPTVRTALTVML